jgi:UDP-N-acetyl-D-glucosamine dehydrogenase
MKYDLSIIGLGYVGLPLGLQFAKSGCRVLGLDIDLTKTKEIEAGRSYIRHISPEDVSAQVKAGRFSACSDYSMVKDSEAVVICVSTRPVVE